MFRHPMRGSGDRAPVGGMKVFGMTEPLDHEKRDASGRSLLMGSWEKPWDILSFSLANPPRAKGPRRGMKAAVVMTDPAGRPFPNPAIPDISQGECTSIGRFALND